MKSHLLLSLLLSLSAVAVRGEEPANRRVIPTDIDTDPLPRLEAGGSSSNVTTLAFGPDGRTLYVGGFDKVVHVWKRDERLGRFVHDDKLSYRVPIGPEALGAINAVAVSPDGRYLAAGGRGVIREGALTKGKGFIIPRLGRLTLDQLRDEGAIYLFDTRNQTVRALRGHQGPILNLVFASDLQGSSPVLVSAGREQLVNRQPGAAPYGGAVRVWDADKGELLAQFPKELPDPVTLAQLALPVRQGLAAQHTGRSVRDVQVAIATGDNQIYVWDVASGTVRSSEDGRGNATVCYASTGQLVTGRFGNLSAWDVSPGRILQPDLERRAKLSLQGSQLAPMALASLRSQPNGPPDQAVVVLARTRNDKFRLHLLDLTSGRFGFIKARLDLWNWTDRLPVVAVSPDGQYLAIAGEEEHKIRVYAVADLPREEGRPVPYQTLQSGGEIFRHAAFVRKGDRIGLALARQFEPGSPYRPVDPQDLIFDLTEPRRKLVQQQGEGWRVDGPDLRDWEVRILNDQGQIDPRLGHSIQIRHNGQLVGTVQLKPTQFITATALLPRAEGIKIPVLAVAFRENGVPYLYLYSVPDGLPLRQYSAHSDAIRCLAFSGDGRLLVSAAEDETVCVHTLTDLPQVYQRRGALNGVLVRDRQRRPVPPADLVLTLENDDLSAENRRRLRAFNLQPDAPVEGLVEDNRLVPFRSIRDYYETLYFKKPGSTVTLRLAGQDVALVVDQGVDERKALFTLFITRDPGAREWLAWSPMGDFDSSDRIAEKHLGWHLNQVNQENAPPRVAVAEQYRQDYHRPGILKYLVREADYHRARQAYDRDWVPQRPDMTLQLTEPRVPTLPLRQLIRQAPRSLRLAIVNYPQPHLIKRVEWRVNGGEFRRMTEQPGQVWTADLSVEKWQPGEYALEARAIVGALRDETFFSNVLLLRYQRPAPVLTVDFPPENVEAETVQLTALVRPGEPGHGFRVRLYRQGQKQELGSWDSVPGQALNIRTRLALEPGQNDFRLEAVNLQPLPGYEWSETGQVLLSVRRLVPRKPKPPVVTLETVVPLTGRNERPIEVTGPAAEILVERPRIRLTGSIRAEAPLTRAILRQEGQPDRPLTNFQADQTRELAFQETVDLKRGRQPLSILAWVKDSEAGLATVQVEFRPKPPTLALEEVRDRNGNPSHRVPRNPFTFSGVLHGDLAKPTKVEVFIKGKVVDYHEVREENQWKGTVQLEEGRQVVTIRVSNEDGASEALNRELIWVTPPELIEILGPDHPTETVNLVAKIRSVTQPRPEHFQATVAGQGGRMQRFEVQPQGEHRYDVVLHNVRLTPGEENQVRLWIQLPDDEGRELTAGKGPFVYQPPLQAERHVAQATLNVKEGVKLANPDQEVEFQIQTEEELEKVTLYVEGTQGRFTDQLEVPVNSLERKPGRRWVGKQQVKLQELNNNLRLVVTTKSGQMAFAEGKINLLPMPVRIQYDSLEVAGEEGSMALPEQVGGIVRLPTQARGRIVLRGRVIWDGPQDDTLDRLSLVRFFVNDHQQLPSELEPAAASKRERHFTAHLVLNRKGPNTVAAEIPNLPVEQQSRAELVVECQNPERGQRLHVLILGAIEEMSPADLKDRILAALHAESRQGQITSPAFTQVIIHETMPTEAITWRRVQAALLDLSLYVFDLKNRDQRLQERLLNDVMIVYYRGGEKLSPEGHYLRTADGYDSIKVKDVQEHLNKVPVASMLLLDVDRQGGPQVLVRGEDEVERQRRWQELRVAVLRLLNADQASAQIRADLTQGMEVALAREALMGRVINYLEENFLNPRRNPGLPPRPKLQLDKALPVGLLDLIIGVGRDG